MNNMNNKEYYEDEINLRDYVEVILKYKWLIIAISLISTITTAVVSLNMPKTYQSKATIDIAKVNGPIYKPAETKQLILSEKVLKPVINEFSEEFKKRPTLKDFRKKLEVENVAKTNFLNITLKYKDAKLAKEMLYAVVRYLFGYGDKGYKEQLSLLKENLTLINRQIQNTEESLKRFEKRAEELANKSGQIPPEAMSKVILLENLISENKKNLNEYLDKKISVNQKIKKAKNWQIINSPEIPTNAISPKKKQMTAIAGVVSLMLAVFLAFFIEFIRTSKPSEKGRR